MRSNYKYSTQIIALVLMFGLASCSRRLDREPLSNFSNETFWTSENNVMLALTGVYRGNIQMQQAPEYSSTDWWSYHGLLYLEFATDNAYDRRGDNSALHRLTSGTLVSNNSYLSNYWNASYSRIARSNYFIENISKATIDAAKVSRMMAEARFIRACQYFYLSQYFGSVPLVTKTLTPAEANAVARAPKSEIVKYAMDELTAAAAGLPQYRALTAAEKGRATKQAALAFLGRLQLADGAYAAAATTYKSIIDFGDNIIDPDFAGLFNGTNESSKEIIFAVQYLLDLASNAMAQHNFPAGNAGFHLYCPLSSIVESYDFLDGSAFSYTDPRYNTVDIGQGRDPRLKYTILYNRQTFQGKTYITHPDSVSSADQLTTTKQATRTGYNMKKFNYEGQSTNLSNSGIDLPVIRYAEVLLSYLEAKLEAGQAIDQALLDQTINAVRGRTSVNMPKITQTNPALLREILRKERRNEMAFEGTRLWDLQRWKIAGTVLKGDFYGASFPGAKNLRKKGTATDPFSRWYVTTKAFRTGVDELWPIPQSEVDINPKLK